MLFHSISKYAKNKGLVRVGWLEKSINYRLALSNDGLIREVTVTDSKLGEVTEVPHRIARGSSGNEEAQFLCDQLPAVLGIEGQPGSFTRHPNQARRERFQVLFQEVTGGHPVIDAFYSQIEQNQDIFLEKIATYPKKELSKKLLTTFVVDGEELFFDAEIAAAWDRYVVDVWLPRHATSPFFCTVSGEEAKHRAVIHTTAAVQGVKSPVALISQNPKSAVSWKSKPAVSVESVFAYVAGWNDIARHQRVSISEEKAIHFWAEEADPDRVLEGFVSDEASSKDALTKEVANPPKNVNVVVVQARPKRMAVTEEQLLPYTDLQQNIRDYERDFRIDGVEKHSLPRVIAKSHIEPVDSLVAGVQANLYLGRYLRKPYPEMLYQRVITRLTSIPIDLGRKEPRDDFRQKACVVKAFLCRNFGKDIQTTYNREEACIAYRLGRWLAQADLTQYYATGASTMGLKFFGGLARNQYGTFSSAKECAQVYYNMRRVQINNKTRGVGDYWYDRAKKWTMRLDSQLTTEPFSQVQQGMFVLGFTHTKFKKKKEG